MSNSDKFFPSSDQDLYELFSSLDPSFAGVVRNHLEELMSRTQLDARKRFLVMTMQYTITERTEQLEETLQAARNAGVLATELLEVILQAYVYAGPWVVASAARVFKHVMSQRGEEVVPAQVGQRDLEAERPTWTDGDDPRLKGLLEQYGWEGISNGLRLRPGHHINMLDTLDALDPHFLRTWLDAVYEGMYGRGVLEDRTRLLCVVGATLAVGETHQSRRHMRAALRAGATPHELLEVIFHTTAFFGHPYVMPAAFDDLIRITDDEGRISELLPDERIPETRRIVAARVARREGIADALDSPASDGP